jgi:hypothetical protein
MSIKGVLGKIFCIVYQVLEQREEVSVVENLTNKGHEYTLVKYPLNRMFEAILLDAKLD